VRPAVPLKKLISVDVQRFYLYLSVVSVMCCQAEVSATSWSLVQRCPTDCGASFYVCDIETSWMKRPWPTGGLSRQNPIKACNIPVPTLQATIHLYKRQSFNSGLHKSRGAIRRGDSIFYFGINLGILRRDANHITL